MAVEKTKKITIIGGGAAGCATALQFGDNGYDVEILEYRASLLGGSSDDTPCRLGLGFHYVDIPTAIKYLHATIDFVKKYPTFVVAADQPNDHPYRRGRYFIVKDSIFEQEQIFSVYNELRKEYRKLVEQDKRNEVFGPPKQFFRTLTLSEYQDDVNPNVVTQGIETAEQILNWPQFKEFFVQQVESHPKITVRKNSEVVGVSHADVGYNIHVKSTFMPEDNNNVATNIHSNFIINSSWENIEKINQTAFPNLLAETRTNRLKVILEIEIPPEFESKHAVNSMFFCFGPHAAFTNLGNGVGFISFEPLTNVGMSTALEIPEEFKQILYGNLSEEDKFAVAEKLNATFDKESGKNYAQQIIDNVAKYIPGLKNAKYKNAKFGIVRTKGSIESINDPKSSFHQRRELGITELGLGWLVNPSMKLLYLFLNALTNYSLAEDQLAILEAIDNIKVPADSAADFMRIKNAIVKDLSRNLCSQDKPQVNQILNSVEKVVQLKPSLHLDLIAMVEAINNVKITVEPDVDLTRIKNIIVKHLSKTLHPEDKQHCHQVTASVEKVVKLKTSLHLELKQHSFFKSRSTSERISAPLTTDVNQEQSPTFSLSMNTVSRTS